MDLSSLTPDKQVKLQYWLDVIRQCRASGLTNQIWCEPAAEDAVKFVQSRVVSMLGISNYIV